MKKRTTNGTTEKNGTTIPPSTSATTQKNKTQLEQTKATLHKLIDDITEFDYVETNSRITDVSVNPSVVHQIFIEKKGNVKIQSVKGHHCHHHFDDCMEDDDDDEL